MQVNSTVTHSLQLMSNVTDKHSINMPDKLDLTTLLPWALAFAMVAVFVVLGNTLVVVSFIKKKALRTHTNYFIVSLSIADLFVGVISAPWWIVVMFVNYHGEGWFILLHNVWMVLDILGGVGSIMHLIALSWDRLCAIVWPLRHRKYSSKRYLAAVVLVWVIAIAVSALAIIWTKEVVYHVTVIALFFFVPLVIICVTQLVIVYFIRKKVFKTTIKTRLRKDIKVAKTVGIMIAIFVLGWFPFFGLSLFSYTNPGTKMQWNAVFAVKLLQYGNSAINPALYAHKFPHFRKAYIAILRSCFQVNKLVRPIRRWSSGFSSKSTTMTSVRLSIYGSVKSGSSGRRFTRVDKLVDSTGSPTITQRNSPTIWDKNRVPPESPNFTVSETRCEPNGLSCAGRSILKHGRQSSNGSRVSEAGDSRPIVEIHDRKNGKKKISFMNI